MVNGLDVLKKLTSRNYIACLTSTALVAAVMYGIVHPQAVAEALANPIITLLVGQFTAVAVLVYQFYFRSSGTKPAEQTPTS